MTYSFPQLSEDLAGHSARTAALAVEISAELGFGTIQQRTVWMAAHLHDVGKVKVPDSILNLPRPLTEHEQTQVQKHPELGFLILDGLVAPEIARAVLCHHERVDGLGYPFGLAGDRIPRMARIIAVADAVDAMVSDRVYQEAQPMPVAFYELTAHTGTQFDPHVVDAALRVLAPAMAGSDSVAVA
jgi:HD-GYP domain-containing protein (c-di-GMP phosphodiesterase class II)